MLPPFTMARSGLAELVWATITARLIMAAAKAVLVPRPAWPSLVPAEEETRNYLLIWVRRFVLLGRVRLRHHRGGVVARRAGRDPRADDEDRRASG